MSTTLTGGCVRSSVTGDSRSWTFSSLALVVCKLPSCDTGKTNMQDLWECELVLEYLHLSFHCWTLCFSSRNVLCLPYYALLYSWIQIHGSYLIMAPSGFWQDLLKDTRGWYGGTVPVSNIGYIGGPWWRTMFRQTWDNCLFPDVPIVVGTSSITEL